MRRTPLYFGDSGRPLFGWLHAPDSCHECAEAVVICASVGHEYVHAHRSLRHFADDVAAAGMPVLRFDYDGVGDSAGRDDDPDRLAAWLSSIRRAVETLGILSGCARISLAGLRMGATLAALVSREIDVWSLVLWAPCTPGRGFVRELRAVAAIGSSRPSVETAGLLEAGGLVMTGQTQQALGEIDLEKTPPSVHRVLVVSPQDLPENPRLAEKWLAEGLHVEQRRLPGLLDMLATPHNARVPQEALDDIVAWLVAGGSRSVEPKSRTSQSISSMTVSNTCVVDGVRESVVPFGDGGTLFGISSEPLPGARPSLPLIVISNAGATHHIGPGRLYVHLTRALSRAGFACLRFDLPGLGDSVVSDSGQENDTYPLRASAVMASAIDAAARARQTAGAVVMGLCSGAHAAFHAALDLVDRPIVEAVLINPLTFYYTPGMPLDPPGADLPGGWFWRGNTFREMNRSTLIRAATGVLKEGTHAGLRMWRRWLAPSRDSALARDLERLTRAGRQVTFVFSKFDPGYDVLMADAGATVSRLLAAGGLSHLSIKDANHTFDRAAPREEMIRSLATHLADRHGPARRTRLVTFVSDFGCGGTERQFVNLVRALDAERFDPEFACMKRWGELLHDISDREIPIREYPLRRLWGARTMRQQMRLVHYLASNRIQILHAFNFHSNVFAIPAARLARVPVVIASIRDRGVYLTRTQRRVQRHVCRLADCVLVNAESIREWLIEDGYDPSCIAVVRNGIDIDRFVGIRVPGIRRELGMADGEPIVTMLSRLDVQKGVEDFIDAAAIVARSHCHARFMIVGQGYVTNGEGIAEDTAYKTVLLDREGLSNTLLESMAAGVPVVATNVGGTPELIQDGVTGMLVPAKSPEALAASINCLLRNRELAVRLGAAGRAWVRDRFGMDRMVRATEDLYVDLLARRGADPGWRRRPGWSRTPSTASQSAASSS